MRRMGWIASCAALFVSGIVNESRSEERGALVIEGGAVASRYNHFRIPGDTGTRVSFQDELVSETTPYVRVSGEWRVGQKHQIGLLIAPLRINARGSVDRPVRFQNLTFDAGEPLTGRFRFDSYRLRWSMDLVRRSRITVGLGLTAKIRDASISLSSAARGSEKVNTGFVPLIHFRGQYRLTSRATVALEGDAAAAPQGRAEDVALTLDYDLTRHVSVRGGYRLLEGGADVPEVYTFTWLNYSILGVRVKF